MNPMTKDEIQEAKLLWGDIWTFWKKYYHGESDEGFWENLVSDADDLGKKYGSKFVNDLLNVCINDIEDRYKLSCKGSK